MQDCNGKRRLCTSCIQRTGFWKRDNHVLAVRPFFLILRHSQLLPYQQCHSATHLTFKVRAHLVQSCYKPSVLFPILWFSPHLAQTKCPLSHSVIQSTPGTKQVSTFPLWYSPHLAQTKCPLSNPRFSSHQAQNKCPLSHSVISPQLPHGKWPTVHSRRDSRINPRWPVRPNWRIVIYSTAKHRLSSVTLLWRWAYAFRSSSVSLFRPCQYSNPQPQLRPLFLRYSHLLTHERPIFFLRQRATPVTVGWFARHKWKK